MTDDQLKEWRRLTKDSIPLNTATVQWSWAPANTPSAIARPSGHVEDTTKYLANYEKYVEGLNKLAKDTNNSVVAHRPRWKRSKI